VPAGRIKHPDYVNARAILDGIEMFDPAFFGMTPREAQIIDPQQRLFLECAHEALETAGYNPDTYSGVIGVYAGTGLSEYFLYNYVRPELKKMMGGFQGVLGNDKDYLATRVSYKLNLKGPSVNVNTACSTSLVAVALACQSLLNAECDMALAGGVSIFYPQKVGHFHQEGGVNSPDGRCRPFDAKAEGTVGGNGVGILVLKRVADALADGDHIHAVIKGAAINNDGAAKVGYTAPSIDGQAKVIGEALAMANLEPESISYIEAHGTATPLGDPIEIAALTKVFRASTARKQFCALGSVKSNIGHLDAAAGVAGLIKTALALEHQLIPASLHYQQPNPKIDFANSPFFVNAQPRAWVTNGKPRRAAVSSFGIGGTNAHVVLEEAPPRQPSSTSRGSQLLVLSARTETALDQATVNLAEYLRLHPEVNLADVAYTCAVGRRPFEHRRVVLCREVNDAADSLENRGDATAQRRMWNRTVEAKYRPVHFLFSGQGSQHVNMGRQLYDGQRVFRETVDRCALIVAQVTGLDLRELMYPRMGHEAAASVQLRQTAVTQPALFITEYALVKQWQHWGVKPEGMLGHSVGEFVAACVAGVLSEEDALRLVAVRAAMMQRLPAGAMMSVGLGETDVRELIKGRVSVAAINGAELTVVSGAEVAIAEIEEELSKQGVWQRRLETSHAFHSEMMEPMLTEYRTVLNGVQLREPQQAYVSSMTGEWMRGPEVRDVEYWVDQVRQPVRFWAGLEQLRRDGESVVVEVGPGKALTVLARAVWGPEAVIVPALGVEQEDNPSYEEERVSVAVGQVWLGGVQIDWSKYYSEERRARLPLPTYPFERRRCLLELPATQGESSSTGNSQLAQSPATIHKVDEQTFAIEKKVTIMSSPKESATTQASRKDHLCSILQTSWGGLMGIEPAKLNPQATFF
jgi:acyl transferase domain-containing protein